MITLQTAADNRKCSHDKPSRLSKFKTEYCARFPHIEPSSKGKEFFFCRACDVHRKLGKMGEKAVEQHVKADAHKTAAASVKSNASMSVYVKIRTVRIKHPFRHG